MWRRLCQTPYGSKQALAGALLQLFHQQHRAAALDLARDFAVHVSRHASHSTGKDFAAFADEFFQEIGVLVIDCFDGDIDPASRHGAIGATECGAAFGRFWLHQ